MGFRNDINGLRAVAVAAVVLFHFNVAGFTGGFAGVDVFFVISGFLMTSIIFPQVAAGRFFLMSFYLSRARRIVPALTALCCVSVVAGWFILLPHDFAALGKHVASALLFVSNIIFNREAGYFDAAPFDKWLLHTWSLSVEWQFYLLYPAVVLILFRFAGIRLARVAIVIACFASLLLSVYATTRWPTAAFYLLPTRAWELLAGGIVFLYHITLSARVMKGLEVIGLAIIGLSCWGFSHLDAWPGYFAAAPVLGCMLVLWANQAHSVLTSNKVAKWIGNWSYSIYLWHWPFVVALHYLGKSTSLPWIVGAITASILAGWASFLLIESPMRTRPAAGKTPIWQNARMFAGTAVLAVLGLGIVLTHGVPSKLRPVNDGERVQFVEHYRTLHESGLNAAYRTECDFYDWKTKRAKQRIDRSCTLKGTGQTVFLWGDSHAQALSLGLRTLVGETAVAQVATSGCPPDIDGQSPSPIQNNCVLSNEFALSEIARLRPDFVILVQNKGHASKNWQKLYEKVRSLGAGRVILVGPEPWWDPSLPLLVARNHWLDPSEFINDNIHTHTLQDDAALRARFTKPGGIEYISVTDALCRKDGSCRAFLPGTRELIAVDYGHLSPNGSIYVVDEIFSHLLTSIRPHQANLANLQIPVTKR